MEDLIFFDVETDGLGSSAQIVAAVTRKRGQSTAWHEVEPGKISTATAAALARELTSNEWVVSFNGCSFDFFLLFNHLSEDDKLGQLGRALVHKVIFEHYDIMFDFLTTKGYRCSLESFLLGCKLKTKLWNGSESAAAWKDNFEKVVEYCMGDVEALENLCNYATTNKCLKRVSGKGKTSTWVLYHDGKFRTPYECITAWKDIPVNQNWMDDPPDPQSHLLWAANILNEA